MVKISIIIPVYETEQYLRQCLDSVLAQSLTELEAICINDGSPDNSIKILREYEKKDGRVKVIDKKNEGVGKARNDGLDIAEGEFVAFMDSDDFYPHNGVLELLYTKAKENAVNVCGGYYRIYYSDGSFEDRVNGAGNKAKRMKGKYRYRDYQFDFGYQCFIFNRAIIEKNNIRFPNYSRFQDPPFFVKTMIACDICYAVDEPTYGYRQVPSSKKSSISKTMDELLGITDNLVISKENNLAGLHYLSAMRLNEDASYMATKNLFDDKNKELFARLIKATACVDTEWLKREGYDIEESFLPEVFNYTLMLAEKYEKIRQSKIVKAIKWLPNKIKR